MADGKFGGITRRFLAIHLILYLAVVGANEFEERDEGYTSGKNLVSEFFLPINGPVAAVDAGIKPRDRRDVEGSGDEADFSDAGDKEVEEIRRTTEGSARTRTNGTEFLEGSGDHEDVTEADKTTHDVPIIGEAEILTTTPEISTEETSSTDETAKNATTVNVLPDEEVRKMDESNATEPEEDIPTTTATEETTTMGIVQFVHALSTTAAPVKEVQSEDETTPKPAEETTTTEQTATEQPSLTNVATEVNNTEPESPKTEEAESEKPEEVTLTAPSGTTTPTITTTLLFISKTEKPVMEPIFTETKLVHKPLEASPGNIIQKKNMSVGVDPQLIVTDTDPTESEAQMDETVSRKLGAYIVIALILLSSSSLVGYILMRKRQNRKRRRDFEGSPESHDTEKALLSLSDYKDHTELEENHLKNNEITPIVVKSNSQINRFEKNTNFSSPKNLNTVATEKNIEKDNVLKSTTENLSQVGGGPVTQATIEDTADKEAGEEDKNSPNMEKLIVKTRIDQDSIPKKPIIINRSSTGYVPIPQDNS